MKSLNDIRLALGTRLGVTEESYNSYLQGEEWGNEADSAALHLYDWLGGLQESLVQALYGAGGP